MNEQINVIFIFLDYFDAKEYITIVAGISIVLGVLFYVLDRK